ncbi:MAG: ATP-binding protein [Chloroflexi bacterium]|nr:ATP-binding protein [Chloroflexota bacterium]
MNGGLCARCGRAPLCGGMGYVRYDLPVGHPKFGQLFRCPNDGGGHADPERVARLRELGNLAAFADKTFDNFRAELEYLTPAQNQSLRLAHDGAQHFAQTLDGWLLLHGTYGCGKTHLAAAVANTRLELGEAVLFVTAPDLLDHLRSTYNPDAAIGYDVLFERIRGAPLLIIDDLGVENPSGWAQEKLFQLLNHRYSHRLPTVVTTNVELDRLDPRIRSRLLDQQVIHHYYLNAPDYRTAFHDPGDDISQLTLYRDMTFATFDTTTNVDPFARDNLNKVLAGAYAYAQAPTGWVVLTSKQYGAGKTHLAAAIANFRQEQHREAVIFVTAPDLLDHLRLTFAPDAHTTFDRLFQRIRKASLLVLDDLGTESATPWAKEKLFQIIDYRYVTRKPTVITTSRLIKDIDDRLISRLLDQRMCKVYEITAPTYITRIKRS